MSRRRGSSTRPIVNRTDAIQDVYNDYRARARELNKNNYGGNHGLSQAEQAEILEQLLVERQEKLRKFDAVASVYQTADSILTNSSIAVRVADFSEMNTNQNAVAWNDGATLFFNLDKLHKLNDETIVSLNGVNYHEVAHLLWTPRGNTDFLKAVVSENLLTHFNILEDARIENLMVNKFPSTKQSLIKSALTYLLDELDEESLANAYPIICGRRFLPLEVRQLVADNFVKLLGADVAKRIFNIVNEYRFLSLPVKADAERGLELIREFAKIIKFDNQDNHPRQSNDGGESEVTLGQQESGCAERKPLKSGRQETGKKQSELQERAKGNDGEAEQINESDESNTNKPDSQNFSESAPTSNGTGESEYDPSAPERKGFDDATAELLRNAIDQVMKSEQIKTEVKQVRNAIRESDKSFSGVGKTSYTYVEASSEARINAKSFSDELIQLQIDNDPAWKRHTPAGKLNIQRTMNMDINDINILFDRWDTGNDAFDIEAVVLMDNSGSMSQDITEACVSAWTIKKALEAIHARTTVYIFDDETKLLYDAEDKAGVKFRAVGSNGSTDPIDGLLEAENILSASRRKTKLLFIITDGDWYNQETNDNTIKRINEIDGAITSLVFLSNSPYINEQLHNTSLTKEIERWRHYCQTFTLVNRPRDIINVARDIVRSLSRR